MLSAPRTCQPAWKFTLVLLEEPPQRASIFECPCKDYLFHPCQYCCTRTIVFGGRTSGLPPPSSPERPQSGEVDIRSCERSKEHYRTNWGKETRGRVSGKCLPPILNRSVTGSCLRFAAQTVRFPTGSVRFVNMNGSGSVPMFSVRFAVRGSVPEPHCPCRFSWYFTWCA